MSWSRRIQTQSIGMANTKNVQQQNVLKNIQKTQNDQNSRREARPSHLMKFRDNSPDNHAAFVDVVGPVGFGRGGHDVDGHGACGLSARHITSKRLRLRLSSCLLRLGFVDGLGLLDDVATLGTHLFVALEGVAAVVTHFCHGEIRREIGSEAFRQRLIAGHSRLM